MNRISHLDGFRGLAILMVFFYHAYARWNDLLGFSDSIGDGGIVKHFHLGVQLFFLISGFVILLSLQRAESFFPFIYRRWLRLFPAMLICSLIIVATASIFDERVPAPRDWTAIMPGLIFLDPYVLNQITGINFSNLDGPFWSLYVEVKFYIFAALFYFVLGSKRMVHAILACYLAWFFGGVLQDITGSRAVQLGHSVLENLDFAYFGWFAAGAAFLLSVTEHKRTAQQLWFLYGVVVTIFVTFAELSENLTEVLLMLSIAALFAVTLHVSMLQRVLSARVLVWFGFISYPLYLLHENIMVSATISFERLVPPVSPLVWPVVMLICLSLLAWLVAQYIEPLVRNFLKANPVSKTLSK